MDRKTESLRPLSAAELLDAWEAGATQHRVEQALTLLAAAAPEIPRAALRRLSIGQRDARLLTLSQWTFGSQIVGLANCPSCSESVEMSFQLPDVRLSHPQQCSPSLSVTVADAEICFRLPDSVDLAALGNEEDIPILRRRLLQRCLLDVPGSGRASAVEQMPEDVVDAIAARMGEADPQANVDVMLSCPGCGHNWEAAFDIASFFWSQVSAWAKRTLQDVHTLATAYGWHESDILSMTATRRQIYLEMVGG